MIRPHDNKPFGANANPFQPILSSTPPVVPNSNTPSNVLTSSAVDSDRSMACLEKILDKIDQLASRVETLEVSLLRQRQDSCGNCHHMDRGRSPRRFDYGDSRNHFGRNRDFGRRGYTSPSRNESPSRYPTDAHFHASPFRGHAGDRRNYSPGRLRQSDPLDCRHRDRFSSLNSTNSPRRQGPSPMHRSPSPSRKRNDMHVKFDDRQSSHSGNS